MRYLRRRRRKSSVLLSWVCFFSFLGSSLFWWDRVSEVLIRLEKLKERLIEKKEFDLAIEVVEIIGLVESVMVDRSSRPRYGLYVLA